MDGCWWALQFQLKLYAMKKYQCHCRRCGHQFHQLVQKGVDNGCAVCDEGRVAVAEGEADSRSSLLLVGSIATKILSLAYENVGLACGGAGDECGWMISGRTNAVVL